MTLEHPTDQRGDLVLIPDVAHGGGDPALGAGITFDEAFPPFTWGGRVGIDPRAFSIVDEFGQRHRPRLARRGGGRLPVVLADGRSLVVSARTVLPTGNGQLRFTPSGAHPIASWDFHVEID